MVSLVYDALLEKCIDDSLLSYHEGAQTDELQIGPLMVKALMGRRFAE